MKVSFAAKSRTSRRGLCRETEAIRAGTINSAKLLGVGDRFGTLAPGKVADFIVLNADPLADITNTRNIDAVWMNGEPVNRGVLVSSPIPSQYGTMLLLEKSLATSGS